jgi:iron complex transport system substrate-binding protein
MRIVSLLPAATEICYRLGLGEAVVGVSPECDHPADARTKRIVSRSLVDYEGRASAETSRLVGERLASGGGLYQVDAAALQSADPDLILTQGLCDVCAPTLGDVEGVARRLPRAPEIVSLDPHTLDEVLEDIANVGRAAQVEDRADDVVVELRHRIDRVTDRGAAALERPGTVCLEWLDPLFVGGHWVPEMIGLAGGVDVLGRAGQKSRRVSYLEVAAAAPEVAILMPCGYDLERTRAEAIAVTGSSWWPDLPAVRGGRAWLVDGSSYFNRPGPRLVDGLEILAHILQPRLFPRAPAPTAAQPWVA